MPLVFITGIAASGKSEILKELKFRGYTAYDTDDDGFSKWQNNETGYIHPKSSVKKEARTESFLQMHSWNIPRQEIKELAKSANGQTIFLCGVASNLDKILDLFGLVFALYIDDETLKNRIAHRTNNDWGKQPHELKMTLNKKDHQDKLYKKAGFTIIDATRPVNTIVDEILKKLQDKS